jgi:multidrug efflux pump subunit AcrA (membrane-fusion protein)
LISGAILLVGIGSMVGLANLKKKPADRTDDLRTPRVDTYVAEHYEEKLSIVVNGEVVPYREIKLSSEITGSVTEKHCFSGQYVKTDDILYVINKEEYDIEYEQAEAEVQQSIELINETREEIEGGKERRDLAEQDFKLQQQEYNRRLELGQNVLSKSELVQTERNMLIAKQSWKQAQTNLDILQQRLLGNQQSKLLAEKKRAKAKLNKDRTTIKAPADGVVVEDLVEKGDYVRPGTQLLTFEDTSISEVKCSLRPRQVQWLWENSTSEKNQSVSNAYGLPSTTVEIQSNFGDEDVKWIGTLVGFDGFGLDERTKMIPCRIKVNQPISKESNNRALIRGMFVRVVIAIDPAAMSAHGNEFVKFPAVAVQPGDYVWTIKDDKLNRHQVKIANRFRDDNPKLKFNTFVVVRETKNGINRGDKIIVTPLSQPEIGNPVKEKN